MSTIKAAISIPNALFQEVDRLAKKWHTSRSYIFSKAAKDFLEKQKNKKVLDSLNKAYEHEPSEEERKIQRLALKKVAKVIDPW